MELRGESKLLDKVNEEKYKLYMQQLEFVREERLRKQKSALLKALLQEQAVKGNLMDSALIPQRVDTPPKPKESFADKSKKVHENVLKTLENH